MAANPVAIETEDVMDILEQARQQVERSAAEVVVDLSSVYRIDAPALAGLAELAAAAEQKAVPVVLRGINIDVYKVLKLVNLTRKFGFR